MFDTYVTVVGTALTTPEWKRVQSSGVLVANFRVASHARRFDRASGQWVDAASLRIRVNCWRRLAEGVCDSVIAGDPVVIYGRISTRDWKTEQGDPRIAYELDAITVGHDLSRGRAKFFRNKTEKALSVVEDSESESRVNGEVSERINAFGVSELGDHGTQGRPADDFEPSGNGDSDLDAVAILRGVGLSPERSDDDGEAGSGDDDTDEEELVGAAAGLGGPGGRSRRRGREPVPA